MAISSVALVERGESQIGKPYVFGADVDLAAVDPPAFDCAEFATWVVYQLRAVLVGCVDNDVPVDLAEPYSGGWARDCRTGVLLPVPIAAALVTPGVALVRSPAGGRIGHVALSDGRGGTIEAHSTRHGVSKHRVSGRRWDHAGLLRGFDYRCLTVACPTLRYEPPARVLRIGSKGEAVLDLKRALAERGYWLRPLTPPVALAYGLLTAEAVRRFQVDHGLVVDGEAGPETLGALGLA